MKAHTPSQRQQMKAVIEAIRKHRRFMVSSHVNPEGDALGSALALAALIKRLGKRAIVGNDGGIPKAFAFFPPIAQVVSRLNGQISPEVAITVDVPILSRTGSMSRVIQRTPLTVNIDHHVSNQRFADVNWVDPKASAVGEMIYLLYRAFGVKPSREEALCLYVSIVTDTGSFRYMSTTAKVHQIASELISTGISPLRVAQDLYECHSAPDLRFLGEVLRSLKSSPDGRVVWLEVPYRLRRDRRPGPEIVDELVNFPRSVRTAQVAFVLREHTPQRTVRVSFRSKGNVDVNRIARRFGGGGHMAASGCTIPGTLAQARGRVLKVVRQELKKS